jgi:hypothetical protein
MSTLQTRQFWTSLLALSGSLLLVSGLFLLFGGKSRLIEGIHQTVSIVFITACAALLVRNRKALLKVIGGRAAVWTLLAVTAFAVLIMAFSDPETGRQHRYGERNENSRGILR